MKLQRSFVVGFLLISLATLALASHAEAQTYTIRAVLAWPPSSKLHWEGFARLQQKVEQKSQGRVRLQWMGGPEVIPPFELAEAVRDGAIDFAWISPAYYIPQMPEASVFDYSELAFAEELATGAFDYINEIHHRKMNMHVIGSGDGGLGYAVYTNKPVTSIKDFAGLTLRVSPSYLPFIRALGANTAIMPPGDVYTAMERGMIDGYTWLEVGMTDLGLQEVTKYKIVPTYWRVSIVSVMNLDVWNSLPREVQAVFEEASREVEAELPDFYEEMRRAEQAILEEWGVETVVIEEADEYLQIARRAGWEFVRSLLGDEAEELIARFSRTAD